MAIKAVTFDLWDTIVFDDSDEPMRKKMGLRSKYDERRHVIWEALNALKPLAFENVHLAYNVSEAAFNNLWKSHSINWTVEERVDVILKGLNRSLPEADKARVIGDLGRMEVDVPPDPIPGIHEALDDLSRRYKLCIVSDSIVTPGTGLRALLDKHGLKKFFSGFAFSDEVGHSKPHPDMFKCAASQLGVDFSEMVHIGDRDHNDVKGPQALGMKAVLFTASRDVDRETTSADAICASHAELPA
ncbi:MAG: HAD family hydrolase, partial [Rhodospirillales bacterium]|nr:HAD family hydrolase [Rhodospirillales bacterium]